jgi:1,4-alpha-glucan branching enzyme
MWIEFLARKMCYDQKTVKMTTPSEYLAEYPINQMAMPSQSSWGYKGYSEFWLEGSNAWVYPHLHVGGKRMKELAEKSSNELKNGKPNSLIRRAVNQAARELVLAESSDWPFIMKTGTMVPYAHRRIKQHVGRFTRLYEDLLQDAVDEDWLAEVEWRDNIFYNIDCAKFYLQDLGKEPKKAAAKAPAKATTVSKKPAKRVVKKTEKEFAHGLK